MECVEILRWHTAYQFFPRHRNHLEAANEIGALPLKIPAANPAKFLWRFFPCKGDLEVAARQAAILGKQEPRDEAHEASHGKQNAHRECVRDGHTPAVEKIDAEIEHAGSARRGR
jgi:hypothetical protein